MMNERILKVLRDMTGMQTPSPSNLDTPAKVEEFAYRIIDECFDILKTSDMFSDAKFITGAAENLVKKEMKRSFLSV